MNILKNAGINVRMTLASYFIKPSEGVFTHEILSRSALSFILPPFSHKPRLNETTTNHTQYFKNKVIDKLLMVSTSHVTHPFLFPQYYNGEQYDWLQHINENDTLHRLQFREERTGRLISEMDFDHAEAHPSRDLVLLFIDPRKIPNEFMSQQLTLTTEEEFDDFVTYNNEDPVLCQGIKITDHEKNQSDHYDVNFLDVMCNLNTQVKDPNRLFLKAPFRLPMGMCGGSVKITNNKQETDKVLGIVEGIVNENSNNGSPQHQKIKDNVVVIPSTVISNFFHETIEKYEIR